jgi:indolepyruvate ferredoxin oxidoreductase beta subunit
LERYPAFDTDLFSDRHLKTRLVDATEAATQLGNVRAANSVILGSVAAFLDVEDVHWEAAIESLVPLGTAEVNLAAFNAGREVATVRLPEAQAPPVGFDGPHEIDINQEWCKGCNICSRFCPEYCLSVSVDGILEVVDAEACTGCRLCELLCPDFAITISEPVRSVSSQAIAGKAIR